jgi:hypothetical protein
MQEVVDEDQFGNQASSCVVQAKKVEFEAQGDCDTCGDRVQNTRNERRVQNATDATYK